MTPEKILIIIPTYNEKESSNQEEKNSIGKAAAAMIKDGDTIIHHCNTGSLATVDWDRCSVSLS